MRGWRRGRRCCAVGRRDLEICKVSPAVLDLSRCLPLLSASLPMYCALGDHLPPPGLSIEAFAAEQANMYVVVRSRPTGVSDSLYAPSMRLFYLVAGASLPRRHGTSRNLHSKLHLHAFGAAEGC